MEIREKKREELGKNIKDLGLEIWKLGKKKREEFGKNIKDLEIHLGKSMSTLNECMRRDFEPCESIQEFFSNFHLIHCPKICHIKKFYKKKFNNKGKKIKSY